MPALLAAAPQLTRILGPLFRAFGVPIEPGLLPPLPPRARRPRPSRRRSAANAGKAADRPDHAQPAEAQPAQAQPARARDAQAEPVQAEPGASGAARPAAPERTLSPQEILRRNPWLPYHPKQMRARLGVFANPASKKPA
jgi:hypothetical protein